MKTTQHLPGHWSESQMHIQQIANHIVATMLITITHPHTGQQITRCGTAAITLPKKKERKHNPSQNQIDLTGLKAQCLQNAAGTLTNLLEPTPKNRPTSRSPAEGQGEPTSLSFGEGRGEAIPHQYLQDLYHRTRQHLTPQHQQHANRILQNHETISYRKLFNQLKKIQQEYNN